MAGCTGRCPVLTLEEQQARAAEIRDWRERRIVSTMADIESGRTKKSITEEAIIRLERKR